MSMVAGDGLNLTKHTFNTKSLVHLAYIEFPESLKTIKIQYNS